MTKPYKKIYLITKIYRIFIKIVTKSNSVLQSGNRHQTSNQLVFAYVILYLFIYLLYLYLIFWYDLQK